MSGLKVRKILTAFCVIYLAGCSKPAINLSIMKTLPGDMEVISIPEECENIYDNKKWEIAVVEFANNTGYGNMTVGGSSSQEELNTRSAVVGAGAGRVNRYGEITSMGAALGVSSTLSQTDGASFMGEFAPSLGTFAQSVIEETVANMGGVVVFSRANLDKIMAEQKFQMTMADQDTVMEFGRLSGVKYIITGSVDNIASNYKAPSGVRGGNDYLSAIISMGSAIYDAAATGWYVSINMTVNLVDAETGKIIYSKSVTGERRATQSSAFRADLVINAAKDIMADGLGKVRRELSSIFSMTGYINEIRNGKKIAEISLGYLHGVKPGDVLEIYDIRVGKDFRTGKSNCSLIKTGAVFEVSNQVAEEVSWGYIQGKSDELKNVRLGSPVRNMGSAHK